MSIRSRNITRYTAGCSTANRRYAAAIAINRSRGLEALRYAASCSRANVVNHFEITVLRSASRSSK